MMEWWQFVMNLESLELDRIEEVLLRHGAQSVTLTDAGDDPVLEPAPGATPLWRDTRMTALFAAGADFECLRADLKQTLAICKLPDHHIETLADRCWEREWLQDFRPMRFGRRLWVSPTGLEPECDNGVIVRLDPGLAFGTGTHATTALCLEWLDSIDIEGKTVLDVGCGSGILGIAALRLGAKSVMAVDIDLQALTATRQNALDNAVDERLETSVQIDQPGELYDLVIANILARILAEQADTICTCLRTGGELALSGILAHQAADVMAAYHPQIEFAPPVCRDGWTRLFGTRT